MVQLEYEGFNSVCLGCGMIGHSRQQCSIHLARTENAQVATEGETTMVAEDPPNKVGEWVQARRTRRNNRKGKENQDPNKKQGDHRGKEKGQPSLSNKGSFEGSRFGILIDEIEDNTRDQLVGDLARQQSGLNFRTVDTLTLNGKIHCDNSRRTTTMPRNEGGIVFSSTAKTPLKEVNGSRLVTVGPLSHSIVAEKAIVAPSREAFFKARRVTGSPVMHASFLSPHADVNDSGSFAFHPSHLEGSSKGANNNSGKWLRGKGGIACGKRKPMLQVNSVPHSNSDSQRRTENNAGEVEVVVETPEINGNSANMVMETPVEVIPIGDGDGEACMEA